MTPEKQDALYKAFPEIFQQKDRTIYESCMPWGCECAIGWYDILSSLCRGIDSHVKNLRGNTVYKGATKEEAAEKHPYPEFAQVKEKFGTLRVYYDGGDDFVDGLVTMAEIISSAVCEWCGKPGGRNSDGGWVRTLCPDCRHDLEKRGPKWRREIKEEEETGE